MLQNEIVNNNVIKSMDDVERAAKAMSASGFFPDSKSAAQAVVKVLAGQEHGFGAFASMTGVSVIQGKPVVGANLTAAAIKQTGKYNYRVTKHTEQECEITFFETGQQVGVSTFTMKDAQAAGLSTKDNWKKYPRNMLFARAISNGQKWYAPDVYSGVTVYTPDEMGVSVDSDGNPIESITCEVVPMMITAEVSEVNQTGEAVSDIQVERPAVKPIKPNEIITDAAWDIFTGLIERANAAGLVTRSYNRNEMTASTVSGASVYLQQAIEKASKK